MGLREAGNPWLSGIDYHNDSKSSGHQEKLIQVPIWDLQEGGACSSRHFVLPSPEQEKSHGGHGALPQACKSSSSTAQQKESRQDREQGSGQTHFRTGAGMAVGAST